MSPVSIEQLLSAVLSGRASPWPFDADTATADAFVTACIEQGLGPLLHFHLSRRTGDGGWPGLVRAALARDARMHVAWDLLREREVMSVIAQFAAAGIDALLLKGTPLAYTHYPTPSLRTRSDTDVFIRVADRAAAVAILERAGYTRVHGVAGERVSYQDSFHRHDAQIDHIVDLHWQINNGQVFAQALTFDEALAAAVAVPQLGSWARTLSPPHALLLACMHRAGHIVIDGHESNRLIWLYDIRLLAAAMLHAEWDEFVRMCATKRMRAISRDALMRSQFALGTVVPERVMFGLSAPGPRETSAAYLGGSRRDIFMMDLRALPRWSDRMGLLREILLPPREYLLAKYRTDRRWLLPWLYMRRVLEGMVKHGR